MSAVSAGAVNGHAQAAKVKHLPLRYVAGAPGEINGRAQAPNASAIELVLAVFPHWESETIQCEHLKDGLTNTLIKVSRRTTGEAVLVRAYGNGTAVLIDREREIASHCLLAQHHLAPELLACFQNGLIYRYIAGQVCSVEDLADPRVWRAIAQHLATWHAALPVPQNGHRTLYSGHQQSQEASPTIWSVMERWIEALPTTCKEQTRLQQDLHKEFWRSARELDQVDGIGQNGVGGESLLWQANLKVVFAHCDLLSGNVIILPQQGDAEDDAAVQFIDYEYAVPAPAAFELANHFSEWGGVQCDHAKLPSRSVRKTFITQYLQQYAKLVPQQTHVQGPDGLFEEVDKFRGIPGLYWGIWALIQSSISQIEFDYAAYAKLRLDEYFAWRGEQDGSRLQSGRSIPRREVYWAAE